MLGMPLRGSNEADATVLMVVVVPAHEGPYPVSCGREAFERARRESRAVLEGAKERLGEGIVVADMGTTERRHDAYHCKVARSVLPFIAAPLSLWEVSWPG